MKCIIYSILKLIIIYFIIYKISYNDNLIILIIIFIIFNNLYRAQIIIFFILFMRLHKIFFPKRKS